MTAQALKKYRTYLTDENGKPVMVQLDLRNKEMRTFYEAMMEDFMDMMAIKQAMKEDDGTRYQMNFEGDIFSFVELKKWVAIA